VLPLDPAVEAVQEAYVRKVVDTVHDLPTVLYEVANESSGVTDDVVRMPDGTTIDTPIGDSTPWQYWVIELVKRYEHVAVRTPHPVGMTFQYPVADQRAANDPLWAGPADWISPGFDDGLFPSDSRWRHDPPPADGRKVVISDTDHYSPMDADAVWAWKAFLRGQNPILYDLGIVGGGFDPPDPALEPARLALGDTRRLGERIGLAATAPAGELASSGYALARPGREYVALRPAGEDELTLRVEPADYGICWHNIDTREKHAAGSVTVAEPGTVTLTSPFPTDSNAAVHLTSP
jgi:hypothetical protein